MARLLSLPPTGALPVRGSLGRALLGKTFGNAGLNSAALVLNFGIAVLLSRLVGPGGYGTFVFAVAVANLLAVPALLGLPSLVVREVAAYRVGEAWGAVRGVARRANQWALASSLIVCAAAALVLVATDWPHRPLRAGAFIGLGLIPLTAVTSLRQSVMQGFSHVVLGRVPETLVSPLLLVVLVLGLKVGLGSSFSATWAVGAGVAAAAAATVLGAVLLRRVLPPAVRGAKPEYKTRAWAVAAMPLLLMGGISTLNDQVGTVLLGAYSTVDDVGLFGVATRVAGVIPFLLLAAVPTLMPWISELHTRGESDRLQRLMTQASRLVFLGSLPLVIAVVAAAGPLMAIFGGDFPGGATPLRILALGQIVNIATGFAGTILIMVQAARHVTFGVAVGAVANIALNVALDPSYGATGAAIAAATSVVLSNILLSAALWRSRRIWSPAIPLH